MKRMIGLALVAAWVVGASASALANCGRCPGDKPAMKGGDGCCAKLNLTAEQKAKIAACQQDCERATSTSERRAKCDEAMKQILTAEQYDQWKAECAKTAASGACPVKAKAAKKGCCPK